MIPIKLTYQCLLLGQVSWAVKEWGIQKFNYQKHILILIFSIIGESFGFIGSAGVVFLFFLLLYKLITLGMQVIERNPFGAYFIFGYMSLILIHTFQNIGMTIGIMPVTGIPLLCISYGGSTVLSSMVGFGIVCLIAVEHSKQGDIFFS